MNKSPKLVQRILCFGDSIVFGESDLRCYGWCDRLKRQLLSQSSIDINRKLYNLGITGDDTDGLKKRFEVELNARIINKQDNIVLLSFGINDLIIHKNKNKVPIEYFQSNIEGCISLAKQKNISVVIMSILPCSQKLDGERNVYGHLRNLSDINLYNECLKRIAKRHQCEYLDIFSQFQEKNEVELLAEDGLHPNANGHDLIFNQVEKFLEQRALL